MGWFYPIMEKKEDITYTEVGRESSHFGYGSTDTFPP